MFGFRKSKERQIPEKIRDETAAPRNDEVTVQITPTTGCMVNTAMATHIGTREYQQDSAYVCAPLFEGELAFGVLCDGMGGMDEGERASGDVVAFVANQISELQAGADIPAFFGAVAEKANELVLEKNRSLGKNAGTTLISAVIRQNELYWLSIGDSRIYILRSGEIVQVSTDHTFDLELQEMVKAGQITPEQAGADPRRDALISYVGAPVLELADINRSGFELKYGDTVLLCSDGLTKILPDNAIAELISRHKGDLPGAASALTTAAFDTGAGGMDNTTVILMQYLVNT